MTPTTQEPDWPELSPCVCGSAPWRGDDVYRGRLRVLCYGNLRVGCGRETVGRSKAEAAAGWNALQAAARLPTGEGHDGT